MILAAALLGFALDCIAGDPRFPLHPVRLLGNLAARAELYLYPRSRDGTSMPGSAPYLLRGALAWVLVTGSALAAALLLPALASLVHPALGTVPGALFVWASIAPRDMASHADAVRRRLDADDIPGARVAVSAIVGRDTDALDGPGVARACVESVAESSVDAVAAPLFWALLLGPWAAFVYRAINTLDSLFGHRTARYLLFGRVSARADDAATFVPARIAGLLTAVVAPLVGLDARGALRSYRIYRLDHESPNSGHPESAFAGALGTRLGGPSRYGSETILHPVIGDGDRIPDARMIREAVVLMYAQAIALLVLGSVLRIAARAAVEALMR